MRHHNRILIVGVMLGFLSVTAMAQPTPYYGALLYSTPWQTSEPPVDSIEPAIITTSYLWLDGAMRLYPSPKIDSFINSLTWSDTMTTFASVFYQARDYNPLSLFLYSGNGLYPNPYKASFSHEQMVFQNRVSQIVGDTGRTGSLLTADIIADVMVVDTICVIDASTPPISFPMVFVNSTILDEIKGKKVPLCVGEDMRARRKSGGATTSSVGTVPWPTYAVPADTGTCLQFQYSPEWLRVVSDYGPQMQDSTGWWVKPGREYIVLLNFTGISADSANEYYTLWPAQANPPMGTSGCMYPVIGGIVQDPNDDFGLGASIGLPVDVWKTRLRARIYNILHPKVKKSLWLHQQFVRRDIECLC